MAIVSKCKDRFLVEFPKFRVVLLCKGASLGEFSLKNARNHFVNIALSLSDPERYGVDGSFAGATLGPCAGRIRGGVLPLGQKTVQLAANEGPNQLHGGEHCLSRTLWQGEAVHEDERQAVVRFACAQPDGLDGWPGNRQYTVTYTVFAEGRLRIDYTARGDKDCWFSLSNHSYWNLAGDFSRPATGALVQINAREVLYNDRDHLPAELRPVADTPFDFNRPVSPADYLRRFPADPQLNNALGYNNAFILGGSPAAVLRQGGRRLQMNTDAPALVLYSGGYLGADTPLAGDLSATSGCALALEAQDWPDAPNFPDAPYTITPAGEVWTRFIEFAASEEE